MATEAPEPPVEYDVHTTAGKIADLERRRYEAVHAGSARAVEKQHAKGKMTARERIDALLVPDLIGEHGVQPTAKQCVNVVVCVSSDIAFPCCNAGTSGVLV